MKKIPVWVIEVTWRRRKGQPVQRLGLVTGSLLFVLLTCKEASERLKVPQSWVRWVRFDGRKHRDLKAHHAKILKRYREKDVEARKAAAR